MECWHVDLIGPLSSIEEGKRLHLPSIDGKVYILLIVDEFSRYVMVQAIQRKSDATQALIDAIKRKQTSTGQVLKRMHSDG
ncbi:hypothetical protein ACXYTC_23095, partial [Escherichia coli]